MYGTGSPNQIDPFEFAPHDDVFLVNVDFDYNYTLRKSSSGILFMA